MSYERRPQREVRGRVNASARSALVAMREVKASDGLMKRSAQYKVKDERIIDVMDEKAYSEHVKSRREAGGTFVVDDGTGVSGYEDWGEEDWDRRSEPDGEQQGGEGENDDDEEQEEEEEGQQQQQQEGKARKRKLAQDKKDKKPLGKKPDPVPPKGNISAFLKNAARNAPITTTKKPKINNDVLQSMLQRTPLGKGGRTLTSTPNKITDAVLFGGAAEVAAVARVISSRTTPSRRPIITTRPIKKVSPDPIFKDVKRENSGEEEEEEEEGVSPPHEPLELETPKRKDPPLPSFQDDKTQEEKRKAVPARPLTTNTPPDRMPAKILPFQPSVSATPVWWDQEEPTADSQPECPVDEDTVFKGVGAPISTSTDLEMFWLDAFEDQMAAPGRVYLFGKIRNSDERTFASCCVAISGMERNLFFLPRKFEQTDEGTPTDVAVTQESIQQEIFQLFKKYNIKRFRSKFVERSYAFETEGVPHGKSQWLKVVYPASLPAIPTNLTGKTFSHIFGTHTSALEHFIVKRNLMGPCWVVLKGALPVSQPISWCRHEMMLTDPKKLIKLEDPRPAPPLSVLALSVRTVLSPRSHQNEVAMISAIMFPGVNVESGTEPNLRNAKLPHFTLIRKVADAVWPFDFENRVARLGAHVNIKVCGSEREQLSCLSAKLLQMDPDVLVGHNLLGVDIDVLLHRMGQNKIPDWSKIGRLRRSVMPKLSAGGGDVSWSQRLIASGRLLCDTLISARELLRAKNYTLSDMAREQLDVIRAEVDAQRVLDMYEESNTLLELCRFTEEDAMLSARLMFKLQALPLSKQLTHLAGNMWIRSLLGGRAERNEYLLLHEFHRLKYVVPDKEFGRRKGKQNEMAEDEGDDEKGKRRKPKYSGGLVLEPKVGLYDRNVLLLDFNSLYPSIIQEFNICFTTVDRAPLRSMEDQLSTVLDKVLSTSKQQEQGVLPRMIRTLVDRRQAVKGLLKTARDPLERQQLNIRQLALKLTANSMYGCLGFQHSRFHAQILAELITSKGRDLLCRTRDLAENTVGLHVIYGDTDSIMIHTNTNDLEETKRLGGIVRKEVNKLYKNLNIDIDGIFKTMLLLRKKKYAAVSITETPEGVLAKKEFKGIDLVRRDWCDLSRDIGTRVLDMILSGEPRDEMLSDIHAYLREMEAAVTENKVPLDKFIIRKSLTKSPEDYPDVKSQPHVTVALRLRRMGRPVRVGDVMEYVICEAASEDSTNQLLSERSFSVEEVKSTAGLKIDKKWYMAQQVHPTISRLLAPVSGTDAALIAECLGLEPTKFHSPAIRTMHQEEAASALFKNEEEKYRDCQNFCVPCPRCNTKNSIPSIGDGHRRREKHLFVCSADGCAHAFRTVFVQNQLVLQIRALQEKFYTCRLVCDGLCRETRKKVPLRMARDGSIKCSCSGTMKPEYPASALYRQLKYFAMLFDVERTERKLARPLDLSEAERQDLEGLSRVVDDALQWNGHRFFKVDDLCATLFSVQRRP